MVADQMSYQRDVFDVLISTRSFIQLQWICTTYRSNMEENTNRCCLGPIGLARSLKDGRMEGIE